MTIKVHDGLPADCALRRGTLISGVSRPTRSGRPQPADPMQPAADQIEQALRARANSALATAKEAAKQSSESTTGKPSENT